MTPHIPEQLSTRLIDWRPVVIMGNTIPPRDPDEDEDEEEDEDEDEDEEKTGPTSRRSCASRIKSRQDAS